MSHTRRILATLSILVSVLFTSISFPGSTDGNALARRPLRVALYPYVPQKAEMYWKLEREFEDSNPEIDLQYVDLAADYYGGQLVDTLKSAKADVVEIDTVFLRDLVDQRLIQPIPAESLSPQSYLPMALSAATVDGTVYGVPHWVCGNFLFFRKDDPERRKFEKLTTLDGLERILGRPFSQEQGLLVDMQGKSTLGEKYLDAVLDIYQSPEEALKHVSNATPDPVALRSLSRLFALCAGGLCDSEKHHESDQFYARQFTHRRARALIGYSERMHFVVDEFLNGLREDEPGVGAISFDWNDATNSYDVVGKNDVDAVSAPLSDNGSKMLAWVDILSLRSGLDGQTRKDALTLIGFFSSERFTAELLTPSYGNAPRYLLPGARNVYTEPKLLKAAPLYGRFLELMNQSVALTSPNLNGRLREIGGSIQKAGFSPRESVK